MKMETLCIGSYVHNVATIYTEISNDKIYENFKHGGIFLKIKFRI